MYIFARIREKVYNALLRQTRESFNLLPFSFPILSHFFLVLFLCYFVSCPGYIVIVLGKQEETSSCSS